MINIPTETPLDKTNFSFASRWQLQIPFLGIRAQVHFPFSMLGPHLTWTCVGPCLLPVHLWVNMCIGPAESQRHYFDKSIVKTLSLLQVFWLRFTYLPEPWEERWEFSEDIPLRNWVFQRLSPSVHAPFVSLWVSYHLLPEKTSLMNAEWSMGIEKCY